jgi:X-Pro dipeptidyl-peptidase
LRALITVTVAVLACAATAHAESAPDGGRAFEPRPKSAPLYGTKAETHQQVVEASDGVDLFVETWLPEAKDGNVPPAKLPTILIMTPYVQPGVQRYIDRSRINVIEWFTQRGYAVAQHHVRGTGASGGCLEQTAELQIDDGARVVEWLGRDAPWAEGNVGMYGISYDGETQISVAGRGDPAKTKYLKAIIPSETVGGQYEYSYMDGVPYTGQAALSNAGYLLVSMEGAGADPKTFERATCQPTLLSNSADPSGNMTPFWKVREYRPGAPNIKAATLWLHGLADWNVQPISVTGFFERLPESTPHKGLFGQFDHNYPDKHGSVAQDWERADWMAMATAWYDRYLKGLATGVERWPDVQIQATDGQWRAEPDYPTTGGPVGQLALGADGVLGATAPSGQTTFTEGSDAEEGSRAVLETPALEAPLHITGMPVLDLWLTTSLPDAHLTAKLQVVGPGDEPLTFDAAVQEIGTHGARSLMHLEPMPENYFKQESGSPAPVGEPLRVPLRLQPVDIVVPPEHRLRVTVAGATDWARATLPSGGASEISLLHDCEHPSALRFLMARPDGPYLNVREIDEEDTPALPSTTPPARITDGGGLASALVCDKRPERLPAFGPELSACRDQSAPAARLVRARLTRRAIRLGGTARDAGCSPSGVAAVRVTIARRTQRRCRFVTSRGRFLRPRRCAASAGPALRARGTRSWSLRRRARLVRGTYVVWVTATDRAGNRGRAVVRRARVR